MLLVLMETTIITLMLPPLLLKVVICFPASGLWSTDLMSFMGQKNEDDDDDDENDNAKSEKAESSREDKGVEADNDANATRDPEESNVETLKPEVDNLASVEADDKSVETSTIIDEQANEIADSPLETKLALPELEESIAEKPIVTDNDKSEEVIITAMVQSEAETGLHAEPTADHAEQLEVSEVSDLKATERESILSSEDQVARTAHEPDQVEPPLDLQKTDIADEPKRQEEETMQKVSVVEGLDASPEVIGEEAKPSIQVLDDVSQMVSNEGNTNSAEHQADIKERSSPGKSMSDNSDSVVELEKVKKEMKSMETALLGAARQAQAKADEIAKLMNENEQLKSLLEDQMRKSNEAEVESIREEYHQKVSTLERKVYALTRERDTLRREQNKKSDAAALLKEKDEIITQVMAEGEELSKKQAAQESKIRKLRAQIREFEEEKKGLETKLQVEESKVESLKTDKAATEKLLQETIEKNQAELAAQKEFYTNALTAAKEAEAEAESRANDEARIELEGRLKEATEREAMLIQTLEELRQTLSRKEQQAVFKEDMLRRDIEDLQKRYQASERRCEELVTQVPESTRPLLRQIEAIQETTARKAEAWNAVERSLNSRLQEAEAKAAGAEERERAVNERLSQTLSRINVLEAQISCLRTEQTQLTKSLEKERQRASESRQDYLALKEEADTHEGRVNQLQEEIRELKQKHKQELHEALTHRELLQQDVEREKAARLELEKAAHLQSSAVPEQNPIARTKSAFENGLARRLSNASSVSSMEESFYLQASLDSSDTLSERQNPGEPTLSSYHLKSKTPNAYEAALRQKEGELASYMSRLASMESIRDSLAEELVKMTAECEKLRSEVSQLPGLKAELDSLRQRHSAALELMGERDEELEELRADIVDLKEMYREQVNILVNKIQVSGSSVGAA
ncbi:TATA element modulatory factor 1 TATA binding protein [Artemisia annua]|uniref:TATA element modulatory factor 1 TATA binding protein n=1 Tax=Artemisia annua TaxID=35608 RepID=A0A2U1MKR7_ARTAN|nr:TATA element modulatory factor 1 TATA binding protein [Artemisia annua]